MAKAWRSRTTRSSPSLKSDAIAGGAFLHPLSLGAVVVLLANDHVLKRAYPGFVTGKLSDFAGLIFFPLLLQAIWELSQQLLHRAWHPSQRALWVSIVVTGIAFSLVKLWPPATEAYRVVWGVLQWPFVALFSADWPRLHRVALVRDPSDLLALPALGVAAWIGYRRVPT